MTLLAVLIVSLVCCSCELTNESFGSNNQIHITQPANDAVVSTPLTIKWTSSYPAGTKYALFFDVPPIPPGRTLRAIPESIHDSTCLIEPSCPQASYLAQFNIYVTSSTHFDLEAFQFSSATYDVLQLHRLTIVALGKGGKREGEASYWVDFRTHPSALGASS